MKSITTAIAFASMMIAGSAMADGFPTTKLQLWVTSLPTVPAGAEMHRESVQVNIAALTLKPQQQTRIAQAKAIDINQNI